MDLGLIEIIHSEERSELLVQRDKVLEKVGIGLLVNKVHIKLRHSHNQEDILSIESPFCNFLFKSDLLIVFFTDVGHVPNQNGVFRLQHFKSDEFLIVTGLYFLDLVGDISSPRLLKLGIPVVKCDGGFIIEHDHVSHRQCAYWFPI